MRHLKSACGLLACGLALSATPAAAQSGWEDRAFLNASLAMQAAARPFSDNLTTVIYTKPASIVSTHAVAGAMLPLDIAGGMRLFGSFGVGLGYTKFTLAEVADVAAQIPSPVSSAARSATATAEVTREDTAIHILGLWVVPITDHIDVAFSGGPSLIWLKQDRVSAITIEDSETFTTVAIAEVGLASYEDRVLGLHAGADLTYFLTPMIGVGGGVRFVRASSQTGDSAIDVGGLQMGVGVRVRIR
jgi:hypothetical protein